MFLVAIKDLWLGCVCRGVLAAVFDVPVADGSVGAFFALVAEMPIAYMDLEGTVRCRHFLKAGLASRSDFVFFLVVPAPPQNIFEDEIVAEDQMVWPIRTIAEGVLCPFAIGDRGDVEVDGA